MQFKILIFKCFKHLFILCNSQMQQISKSNYTSLYIIKYTMEKECWTLRVRFIQIEDFNSEIVATNGFQAECLKTPGLKT